MFNYFNKVSEYISDILFVHHNAAYYERGLAQGTNSAKVGTAAASHVLEGKTFTNANGVGLSGTLKNRGALNWNPASSTSYSVPAGYYSGGTLSSVGAYNAGMTAADNRANTNSTNYKTGYNAGVLAADNRVNINSASYSSGYNAGLNSSTSQLFVICDYVNPGLKTATATLPAGTYTVKFAEKEFTNNPSGNIYFSCTYGNNTISYNTIDDKYQTDDTGAAMAENGNYTLWMKTHTISLSNPTSVTVTLRSTYNNKAQFAFVGVYKKDSM